MFLVYICVLKYGITPLLSTSAMIIYEHMSVQCSMCCYLSHHKERLAEDI